MSNYAYRVADEIMRITKEWAKQLAFEMWGNLDFAKMHFVYVSENTRTFVLPIISTIGADNPMSMNTRDEVKLEPIEDDLNDEITFLGYSENANTLLIGGTIKISQKIT